MKQKEISTLLEYCKALATAYHSSNNFAHAVHDAQKEVVFKSFQWMFNFQTREWGSMDSDSGYLYMLEQSIKLHEEYP